MRISLSACLSLVARAAFGFEAEPTHAALTESAALASPLDEALRRWGRTHGLFDDVRLTFDDLDRVQAARLRERLQAIDPGGGYAPSPEGTMQAAGWVIAGSVIEDVPADRGRHHFLDPTRSHDAGLNDARAGSSFLMSLLGAVDTGGTLAGIFTGTNFDLTGEPADAWVETATNDLSYLAYLRHLAQSASAKTPRQRDASLARAFLALGGVLHVVQDMASPSRVRNDFREAHMARLGTSVVDRGAAFERFVALAYGASAPEPGPAGPPRTRLRDFLHSRDGLGLADFTARNFFSPGTLPRSFAVTRGLPAAELLRRAQQGLARPEPSLRAMEGPTGYVRGIVPHLVHHRRNVSGLVRFDLDHACYADYARALVAEAVRSTRDVIAFALRGRIEVKRNAAEWVFTNRGVALSHGQLDLLWQDANGQRQSLTRFAVRQVAQGAVVAEPVQEWPKDATQGVLIFDGHDLHDEPIVIVETFTL